MSSGVRTGRTGQSGSVPTTPPAGLAAGGATFADVVKLTFYVTDVAFLPAVCEARDAFVDAACPPASTAVQVEALFRPELLLEAEAFAVVRDRADGPAS
jgi:enamine deaminase RidA (YjgF/YER057c/UK114 family)